MPLQQGVHHLDKGVQFKRMGVRITSLKTSVGPTDPGFAGSRLSWRRSVQDNADMDRNNEAVFLDWQDNTRLQWGRQALCLSHRWHEDALFSMESLAALIERHPMSSYSLMSTGPAIGTSTGRAVHRDAVDAELYRPGLRAAEAKRGWREGTIGNLSGAETIAAIGRGGMWLNLRDVQDHDPRYAALIESAHAELARRIPGFEPKALRMGILVSSPDARVHFHADLPGQALWQIAGRKRVYLYPPRAPFLPPEVLEHIAMTAVEVGIPYEAPFDEHATVFDLEPGQMLHWPLNSPHRVDNLGVLNISVTTEYWTPEIRRSQMVTLANGLMRRHLGVRSPGRALNGPSFWAKAALQAGWRRSPWAKRERRLQRPITFRLDRDHADGRVEMAGATTMAP
ncbi:MAG: hypothetical protein JWQ11_3049 [Rhizobacter sp.]|nr:hypothetical protein [Rhizobacter sp.]